MTHELGPDARALLDAAREGLGPDAAAVHRMRQQIATSIASAPGPAAGAIAAKLGVVAVVAAVAIGALVFRGRERDQLAPRLEIPATRVEPAVAPAVHETMPRAQPEPEHIEMAPMAARPVTVSPALPVPAPAAAPAGFDLAREVELVGQGDAALRRHDPAAALAAVRRHAAETAGAGQLAEEAAAIEIEALCHLHDPITAAKLDAFDARWPQSAQRSRLSTTCR